jgi:hypothetical protein
LVTSLLVCCRGIPSVEASRPTHGDRYLFCSDRRFAVGSLQFSRQCVADP